ncbi:MAG: phosphate/phosphite/phosphonate ABC transporter substrate-binding protein [Burkholderiaceae bacterium]
MDALPRRTSGPLRRPVLALLCLALLGPLATPAADQPQTLTVGLIATTTVERVIENWKPFTEALARELQTPVRVLASKSYADIASGLRDGRIQLAWINNKLAIELVENDQAAVFAQMARLDGSRGYKSVLLARKDGPIQSLADVLSQAGRYSFGSGDKKSTSGYLVPNYHVFAKNKIEPEKHFKKLSHANHLDNFLAVADGRVDLATNNTEELPRYRAEYPEKFTRVSVIWESPLIPNDPILYRKDLGATLQQRIKKFFTAYGRTEAEKTSLKNINGLSGFRASSNYQLRPVVDLELFQMLTTAMAENANSPENYKAVMNSLTKRAARLDTVLNATRLDSP